MNIQNNPAYIDDESTLNFPRRLMFIIEWLLITLVKVIREGNLPPHALKSTIGEMLTSLTLMGHLSYLLYHVVILSC